MKFVKLIKSEKGIPAVEYRRMNDGIHHLAIFNSVQDAKECFDALRHMEEIDFVDDESVNDYLYQDAFKNCVDDIEVDYRTIQKDPKYNIINKSFVFDIY